MPTTPATKTRASRAATTTKETTVSVKPARRSGADPKPQTAAQKRAEAKRQAVLNDAQKALDAEPAKVTPAEPETVTVSSTAPRNAITESLKRGLSIEATAKEHGVSVAKVKAAAAIVAQATAKKVTDAARETAKAEATAEKAATRQAELDRRAKRDETISTLADEGKTVNEIAEAVELSPARTSQLLVRLGKKAASAPRGTANSERDDAICEASKGGESIEDISERTGLSVARLRQILSKGGATKGRTSKSPEHDDSPEAVALRAAIDAVKACGISLLTAAAWERADRS